jgi:hypothetical protein
MGVWAMFWSISPHLKGGFSAIGSARHLILSITVIMHYQSFIVQQQEIYITGLAKAPYKGDDTWGEWKCNTVMVKNNNFYSRQNHSKFTPSLYKALFHGNWHEGPS